MADDWLERTKPRKIPVSDDSGLEMLVDGIVISDAGTHPHTIYKEHRVMLGGDYETARAKLEPGSLNRFRERVTSYFGIDHEAAKRQSFGFYCDNAEFFLTFSPDAYDLDEVPVTATYPKDKRETYLKVFRELLAFDLEDAA